MARSAAQKTARNAARRLKDLTRLTFPLFRLPPELQLLVWLPSPPRVHPQLMVSTGPRQL